MSTEVSPTFAAIFDMNGVVIDDMPFHKKAWRALAAKFGKTISEEEFNEKLSGKKNDETIEYLLGKSVSAEEIAELSNEKELLYRELYRDSRAFLPGLLLFLDELKAHGIRTAVATAAPPDNVTFILDELGIRDRFNAVVDASQVSRGKPDPEIFLEAASRIGASPNRTIVFEDGLLGMEAARRAGMRVVAVSTTHAADEIHDVAAIIPDFEQMSFAKMRSLLGA